MLQVLAGTRRPLTGREITRLTDGRSLNGVQKVLARLVRSGIAQVDEHANTHLYSANRNHLAWPAISQLSTLSTALDLLIKNEVAGWEIQPESLAIFGSAARRDGDEDSDIDILIVSPTQINNADLWQSQIDRLSEAVEVSTGNRVQIFATDRQTIGEYQQRGEEILGEWRRDGRTLGGSELRDVLAVDR